MECKHNARTRYTHGFYCRDCHTFFNEKSATYRSGELLSNLWMCLHNINAKRLQDGLNEIKEVWDMRDKIGIGIKHENYEQIIDEAEAILYKYKENRESATIVLKG